MNDNIHIVDNTNLFATETDGLPKTDFSDMLWIGKRAAKKAWSGGPLTSEIAQKLMNTDGKIAGQFLFEECAKFEAAVKAENFNSLAQTSALHNASYRMLAVLLVAYQLRLNMRKAMFPEDRADALDVEPEQLDALVQACVDTAIQKDKEYGASWCKRGGIGAWFTTVRKFDRIATQLGNVDNDLWDIRGDVGSTEALEETLIDAVNYLLLIEEKRYFIMTAGDDERD
jgi:hypothetical protein